MRHPEVVSGHPADTTSWLTTAGTTASPFPHTCAFKLDGGPVLPRGSHFLSLPRSITHLLSTLAGRRVLHSLCAFSFNLKQV